MRLSRYPIPNLKETPAEAEIISHQLMLRAGLIRRLAAGLYTWLPMGLRVLRKVENRRAVLIEVIARQSIEETKAQARRSVDSQEHARRAYAHR